MGEVARFYIGTLAYTGLRPGELRKAQLEDLDLSNWTLRVSHPKGESSYGRNRQVPIPALLRPIVLQYLQARDRMLAEQGIAGATSLVCTMKGTTYSSKQLRLLKRKVSEKCGVAFELMTLRRTFGQVLLNRGVSIETVSLTLGHASTRTTETYYCRKDADSARSEVLRALAGTQNGPSAKNPLIERRELITGYG
jgi:integrase